MRPFLIDQFPQRKEIDMWSTERNQTGNSRMKGMIDIKYWQKCEKIDDCAVRGQGRGGGDEEASGKNAK